MSLVYPGPGGATDGSGPPGRSDPGATLRGGPTLSVRTEQARNRCLLALKGRLVAETVGLLDSHVDELGCRWCDEVTVDLAGVERIDAVGAGLLVGLRHYGAARGGRLTLRGASRGVQAMIDRAETELASR